MRSPTLLLLLGLLAGSLRAESTIRWEATTSHRQKMVVELYYYNPSTFSLTYLSDRTYYHRGGVQEMRIPIPETYYFPGGFQPFPPPGSWSPPAIYYISVNARVYDESNSMPGLVGQTGFTGVQTNGTLNVKSTSSSIVSDGWTFGEGATTGPTSRDEPTIRWDEYFQGFVVGLLLFGGWMVFSGVKAMFREASD